MSYYQVPQGAGRYMVPWYFPVQHPLYTNYPVDPNHAHWIPAHPYGNAPIVNGRQSENDGSEGDSNVDDERVGGAAAGYPPPGVGLPAVSTMQQQPVYQMMPPFSNVYVGSVPSAVNVQGFVNSPIPYPHPYSAIAPSAELTTPPNNVGGGGGRGGSGHRSGAGGKAASGGKMAADKGLNNSADSSPYNAAGSLSPLDSNAATAANDPSAPTLPPNLAPPPPPHPHPQANILPFGAMQYGYSYFPQAGHHPPPPPHHLASAQHAAGSPLYIPHPSMPVYHAPIYSSGPAAAVFSTDNGLPSHSAPVTMPPPADLVVANHEVESTVTTSAITNTAASPNLKAPADTVAPADAAPNAIANSTTDNEQCKQSNLLVDSAPFQPENKKSGATGFLPENTSAEVNVSALVGSIENITLVGLHSTVQNDAGVAGVTAEKKKSTSAQNSNTIVNDVTALPVVDKNSECAKVVEKVDAKSEKGVYSTSENNVSGGRKVDIKETAVVASDDKDKTVVVSDANASSPECLSNAKITQQQLAANVMECADHAAVETASRTSETGSNESKSSSSPESVDGKSNSSESANSSGFESGVSKLSSTAEKEETSEECSPPPSAKTWASLFKVPSSSSVKSKASPATAATVAASRLSSNETSSNSLAAPTYATQNADSAIHSSSSSLAGHTSSLNGGGVPVAQYSVKSSSYRYSSSSSMSLADDTALPKIGELLKNYKLDHRAVNFEPRGLDNRSNFCYVNAILQALLACPPFYNLMKCISHNLHNTKTKLASKQHFPIIDGMVQFVDEFKLISQKARRDKVRKLDAVSHQEIQPGKSFEPSSMYNVLSVIQNNSVFTMGQQEDAQEFLTCLLNGLNDEMVELIQLADGTTNNGVNSRKIPPPPVKATTTTIKNNKKLSNGDIASEVNPPDDSDSEWKQVHSKIKPHRTNNLALTRTPLSEIFRGQMRSRVQKVGDSATNNIEPFFTLHLNIEKASSVKDALELLVGRDALEGVTSSRTNQEVDAWQQQTLEELPYVLLLHLKYFDFKHHTCTKIMKSTEFPIDLKLDIKLISSQSTVRMKTSNSKSRQYKLFAVVYHDGKEASKGHYITDVFHIGYGGWIRYDDSRVYTVSENDVLKPKLPRVPYLLYYRRCDTIAALMQPPFEKRQWW